MRLLQLFRVFLLSVLCAFSTMAFGQFNCVTDGTISLSPTSISFPNSSAASGGFQVTESATCGYTPSTLQSWIHMSPSGLSIPFTVDANNDICSRTGSIKAQITDQFGNRGASAFGGVTQPGVGGDFVVNVTPVTQPVIPGGSVSSSITVSRSGAFNGPVGLSVSGLPSGATASISNYNGSTAALVITVAPSTPPGSYSVDVNGVNSCVTRTAIIDLEVALGVAKGITTAVDPVANTMEVDFIGTDAHVHQFSYNGAWSQSDLSALTGAPAASTSGPGIKTIYNSLGNSMEVHFIGADQHVHTLWFTGSWHHADLTVTTGAPLAALNSSITAAMDPIGNTEDVEYIGTDQRVHQLWYNGTWHTTDITAASGAVANADSSSGVNTLMNTIGNAMEVHYIGTDHHIYSLWYNGAWHEVDHTLNDGAPLAQAGSPLTSALDTIAGTEDLEYVNTSQHVQQLWYNGLWHPNDLTVASGAANLASNGGMHTLVNTIVNTMEVHYVGTDQHVYALWYNGAWHSADLTITTGAPAASVASPLTSAVDTVGSTIDIEFVGTDQHVHQLWYNGLWNTTDLTAMAP